MCGMVKSDDKKRIKIHEKVQFEKFESWMGAIYNRFHWRNAYIQVYLCS